MSKRKPPLLTNAMVAKKRLAGRLVLVGLLLLAGVFVLISRSYSALRSEQRLSARFTAEEIGRRINSELYELLRKESDQPPGDYAFFFYAPTPICSSDFFKDNSNVLPCRFKALCGSSPVYWRIFSCCRTALSQRRSFLRPNQASLRQQRLATRKLDELRRELGTANTDKQQESSLAISQGRLRKRHSSIPLHRRLSPCRLKRAARFRWRGRLRVRDKRYFRKNYSQSPRKEVYNVLPPRECRLLDDESRCIGGTGRAASGKGFTIRPSSI